MVPKHARTACGVFASFFLLFIGCGGGSSGPPAGATPKEQSWTLVWSDEFDGANASAPDATKWVFDLGGGGWGNNELETYTSRTENAYLQDGVLVIQARQEDFTGVDGIARQYTSARLKTLGRFQQTCGRFEARLQLPSGQGLWPAFWMMGTDVSEVGWPQCGEIDIMENIGSEPSVVHGTIHGPGYSGDNGLGSTYTLPGGQRFADDFHVFAVEWERNAIGFFVDGHLYATRTPDELPAGTTWVFDHPFFLIMNVAVGGSWPGNPDSTTVFPQQMLVDYVRVYKRGQ
jgi:beta-glucanase (GH16 family)